MTKKHFMYLLEIYNEEFQVSTANETEIYLSNDYEQISADLYEEEKEIVISILYKKRYGTPEISKTYKATKKEIAMIKEVLKR